MENETQDRLALRDLVEAIRVFENNYDRGTHGDRIVIMTDPSIVSAMRQAEAVLGIKKSK